MDRIYMQDNQKDTKTLYKLGFDKIQQQWAELSYGAGGRNKVEQMALSHDTEEIERWLDETEEAMELSRFQEPLFLSQLPLIKTQIDKVKVNGILQAFELREIYRVINAAKQGRQMTAGKKNYPALALHIQKLQDNPELRTRIDRAIDEDGQIRDDASPDLRNIRKQIQTARSRIKSYLQDFIHAADKQKLLQDAIVTERDGRYVIPVKQEYRYEVKGIIHDESASGATVFIEPLAVVEQNNRIRSLQNEEKREILRILTEISAHVNIFGEELSVNQDVLSQLDFIFSRARLAYRQNAYRPQVNRAGIVEINRARHPLLGEQAVPISISLGQNYDLLVITGPNTGGKTVVLKTLGLLTLMTMAGLFIPAQEKSQVAIFDAIYVDIGDEQSIEQSLSTFSSHMSNIISILHSARPNSLVLLDELGAGTDPAEGAALARVILEALRAKQTRVVVTTHQSELKNYAFQNQRVENACVEFDPVTLQPTYALTIGMPGQSNAFSIAQRLGLDKELVNQARELVPQNEAEISNMLRQLKESRYAFESLTQKLEEQKKRLQAEQQQMQAEKEAWEQEREALWEKAQGEADRYVKNIRNEADAAIKELKETLKKRSEPPKWHEVEKSRRKIKILGSIPNTNIMAEDKKYNFKPGDYVYIKDLKQKGHILSKNDQQDEVMVQVGIMRLGVKASQLVPIDETGEKPYTTRNKSFLEKAQHISAEIDLRGQMAAEALEVLDKYIDDAVLVGLPQIRIIHGKGTGALRKAIQSYLQNHPSVGNYRDGRFDEGGHGVTVVEFS